MLQCFTNYLQVKSEKKNAISAVLNHPSTTHHQRMDVVPISQSVGKTKLLK